MTLVMWTCKGCKRVCRETVTKNPIVCAGCAEPFENEKGVRMVTDVIENMRDTSCPNCGMSWDVHMPNGDCLEFPLEHHERGYQALMRGEAYDS